MLGMGSAQLPALAALVRVAGPALGDGRGTAGAAPESRDRTCSSAPHVHARDGHPCDRDPSRASLEGVRRDGIPSGEGSFLHRGKGSSNRRHRGDTKPKTG